ncbi:hypothetical protein DL96DRAFT_1629939 [Flagelloscypha sp. PMI_526]|nr:hypothetical protein DL96DRAFT_1629939 [Flagelloscypha sp. PMI_526]
MNLFTSLLIPSSFFLLAAATYPGGKIIESAPVQFHTGIKQIPDEHHPYQAPGQNDLRGPCPGLNTLANHGYLPKSGVATFEEIVNAVGEGFNMEHDLASGLAAFAMLARGNSYTNQVSIGIATHGRFEGDVSMTRRDAAVGDNVHLDPQLFQQLLDNVALYGNDSDVTGPKSVVSYKAMQEFKYERYIDSVANNPDLEFHFGRFALSYGEASFTLNFFANGTDGVLSTDTLKSFFQNHTFPANWHRRSSPGTSDLIGDGMVRVLSAHPDALPGRNVNGTFVPEPTDDPCELYRDIGVNTVPAILVSTTGVLKTNVDFLLQTIHNLFPNCTFTLPVGAAEAYTSNDLQKPTETPNNNPSGQGTTYVASGGASISGALEADMSSPSDSGFSKWAPIVIGLLAANLFVGLVLVTVAVLGCIRRGGREVYSSRSLPVAYAPVREKDWDSSLHSGESSYRDNDRPYSEQ